MKTRLAMLAMAAGLTAHAYAQCPPNSQAPVPQSPVNSNVAPSNVTFTWTPSAAGGVTGYEVHGGNSTTANPQILCTAAANATSCNSASPISPGPYTWFIRAKFGGTTCTGLDSSRVPFTVGCPQTGPALQAPAAGATNVSQTPLLQWNAVADADRYDIFFGPAGSGACSGSPSVTTSGINFQITQQLAPATTYEWRVGARRDATTCLRVLSACQTFTTGGVACPQVGAFTTIGPPDGAALTATPTLSWSASSGASQYLVSLGQTNPPSALANGTVAAPATSFTPGTLAPGRYYWFVTASPACGSSGKRSTTISTFTIASCPTAPKLVSPADGATGIPTLVKFDWDPVVGATDYRLNALLSGSTNATVLTTTKDTEYTGNILAGTTEWWAEALGANNCPPAASAHFRFTAGSGCPSNPGIPSLVSPANGATGLNSPVTFQWTAVPNSSGYRVFGQLGDTNFLIGSTAGATQLTAAVPKGTINWVVEARFGDTCPSTVSRSSTFTAGTGAACGTTAATLLSPANNASGVEALVEFKWSKVDGASGYKLFINNQLLGFTTETSLKRLVGDGSNTWRIDTTYAGCADVRSADFTFTAGTAATCGGSIIVTAPAEGSTVAPPVTATWTAVDGASAYRVYASLDGGAPELIARTTATSRSLPLPSGNIELFVEVLFDPASNCPSIFSPHVKFAVAKAATCDSHRPVTLIAPIGGATTGAGVIFDWAVTDAEAVLYRLWVSMNGEPFTSVGVTTETEFEQKLPPGKGTWFVESFFNGCPPVASTRETFTIPAVPRCIISQPVLVAPVDGATNVNSPVTFVWNAVAETGHYRVFVSLDGGAFVQIAETDDVTSITRALPSGSYRWFTDAVLEGCAAVRSAVSRFTIPRAQNCATDAPQLLAPTGGATLTDSQVTLAWAPVSGAIGYIVFARVNDGAFTRIDETIFTRLSRHFPEGRIDWFVVVVLNGCPSIESARSTFTIPSQAGCDNSKPLLHSPPDRAVGVTSPVRFIWTAVPNAKQYKVWAATGDDDPSVIGTTTDNKLTITVPGGVIRWYVQVLFEACPPLQSAVSSFIALKTPPPCAPPERTVAHAPGLVASGSAYSVRWGAVANSANFELQESQSGDFTDATSQVVGELFATFMHTAGSAPQKWFYRVRAVSNCLDARGPFSPVITVVVLPDAAQQTLSIEAGSSAVAQKIFIPGKNPAVTFTAGADKPWAHVTPASGTIGPAGLTLTITYDNVALKLGTNTATINVNYLALGKVGTTDIAPKTSVPVSVSTVTPVTSGGKSGPPQTSMIIPVVGHAAGVGGALFESDVRVANTSATTMKYQLNFTLSRSDGTQSGQSTTVQIAPGETMALDDILTSFFGLGTEGASATGVLEIRPLTTSTSVTSSSVNVQTTVASSRTYNSTPTGTYGQYIPAIPFSQFIGTGGARLTLQQVAQSPLYRSNLGLTEGAGEPADVTVHVFNLAGAEVGQVPYQLLPGEHRQIDRFLSVNNIPLEEGRFEIEVTSATGKVTAYASTVDNATNDPLCVLPVLKGALSSSRYVIPGVADLNSPFAAWRSDIRIFNSGAADVTATLAYFPQPGNTGATTTSQVTIKAGEVKVIDNAMQTLYGLTNSGGAILLTTPSAVPLVVTARTYNQTATGTFGQFIPAATPAESSGLGDRTIQLLQLEQSDRARSNIGIAETSGNPVTVELSAIVPDSKVAIKTQFPLGPNEFLQTTLGTGGFNLTNAYNVRVTVKVLSGTGKVTAYGSMIDAQTGDPTFVPPL
ncbi:MAG: hypothetical protein AABO58_06140 [Acidobacteriota bacterium]